MRCNKCNSTNTKSVKFLYELDLGAKWNSIAGKNKLPRTSLGGLCRPPALPLYNPQFIVLSIFFSFGFGYFCFHEVESIALGACVFMLSGLLTYFIWAAFLGKKTKAQHKVDIQKWQNEWICLDCGEKQFKAPPH